MLGFRIDPKERLQSVHKELFSLQKVYGQVPLFGVQFTVGEQVDVIVTRLQHSSQKTYTQHNNADIFTPVQEFRFPHWYF